jgi:hypothetical protein
MNLGNGNTLADIIGALAALVAAISSLTNKKTINGIDKTTKNSS